MTQSVVTQHAVTQSVVAPAGRPKWSTRRREKLVGLLFVLPVFILFVVFRFGPAIAGLGLSFFDYSPGTTPEWLGLENFRRLMGDDVFWSSLKVSALFTALSVPLTLGVSTILALAVRWRFRGVAWFRSVFFLPVITSLVVAGVIFTWVFSANGPVSTLLESVGLPGESWLNSNVLVIPALVLVSVWSRFGYGMLIVLARLQDLPRDLEEAAFTDGANAWQRFRYIVLPQLRPALFFLAIIETTASFQVFDLVYVMTSGGPARSSYTLILDLYDQGFKYFDLGYASAIGVALFVMTLVVAGIQRLTLGRES